MSLDVVSLRLEKFRLRKSKIKRGTECPILKYYILQSHNHNLQKKNKLFYY